jgi:hypothetical protein
MTSFKYIAAVLALVGAVGSAQAAGEVQNDQVQFMADHELNEVVGAKFAGFTISDVNRALNYQMSEYSFFWDKVSSAEVKQIKTWISQMGNNSKKTYTKNDMDKWLLDKLRSAQKN